MPMDYIFTTITLGFKVSTLLAGAMLFSGGNWVQALGAGQQGGVGKTGYATPTSARYMTFWSDVTSLVAQDSNPCSDVFVHDHRAELTERVSVDSAT